MESTTRCEKLTENPRGPSLLAALVLGKSYCRTFSQRPREPTENPRGLFLLPALVSHYNYYRIMMTYIKKPRTEKNICARASDL